MTTDVFGSMCFALAIVHALAADHLREWLHRRPRLRRLEHTLTEVELTFPLWAVVYLAYFTAQDGVAATATFLGGRHFHEPLLILVVMTICSVGPILRVIDRVIAAVARRLPFDVTTNYFASALVLGPLLGSLVTEPAAMTVTAAILRERLFKRAISARLRYQTLALLFVNVSVGGLMSTYASPPVLMAAGTWGWNWGFMLRHFAGPAAATCILTTLAVIYRHRAELRTLSAAAIAHTRITARPNVRAAVLVALFLGGLVILGPAQRVWVEPLITGIPTLALYLASIGLTAIVDNAALTYLGAQVPDLSAAARLALVSGAVVGGGLTLIANAPNAAGYGALKRTFAGRFDSLRLLRQAALPTAIAMVVFGLALLLS